MKSTDEVPFKKYRMKSADLIQYACEAPAYSKERRDSPGLDLGTNLDEDIIQKCL